MHKMVNGKRIELSEEEEAKILTEWQANEAKREERINSRQQKQADRKAAINKIAQTTGLTEEEMNLLF